MSLARSIIGFTPFWVYKAVERFRVASFRCLAHIDLMICYFLRKTKCKIRERHQLAFWVILTLKEGN